MAFADLRRTAVLPVDDVVKNDLDVRASAPHGPMKILEDCGPLGRIFGPAYSPHDGCFGEHLVDRIGPSLIPDFVEPAAHQLFGIRDGCCSGCVHDGASMYFGRTLAHQYPAGFKAIMERRGGSPGRLECPEAEARAAVCRRAPGMPGSRHSVVRLKQTPPAPLLRRAGFHATQSGFLGRFPSTLISFGVSRRGIWPAHRGYPRFLVSDVAAGQ